MPRLSDTWYATGMTGAKAFHPESIITLQFKDISISDFEMSPIVSVEHFKEMHVSYVIQNLLSASYVIFD